MDETTHYVTGGGVRVERRIEACDGAREIARLAHELDRHRGLLLSSSYEVPGRYARSDVGFVNPPLVITARDRALRIEALNERGSVLLPGIQRVFEGDPDAEIDFANRRAIGLVVRPEGRELAEEDRTRRASVFSVLRRILDWLSFPDDPNLGLYGALGHDLAFQLEPIRLRLQRDPAERHLVLYLPDELTVVDPQRGRAYRCRYDFDVEGRTTRRLPRTGLAETSPGSDEACDPRAAGDHAPAEYRAVIEAALAAFRRGDLFEVTASQSFYGKTEGSPSAIFARLRERNPSPYGFLVNLGAGEHLVGASPEMFVRVQGRRIETCPIAGTVARGTDAIDDASQIQRLLNSKKDECELTMCTDVDRNDKARVCEAGSVRVVGRRQIELYSRLIHTVDHVEGRLRDGCDGLDGFMSHMWAVTLTGAPKPSALQFIEDHEKTPRGFYGGAVGVLGFDGHVNTGITIRAVHVRGGSTEVRAGASLVFDSNPDEEERETRLKAQALFEALRVERVTSNEGPLRSGSGKRVLLVDHRDSFVHTLGDYFRQTGARVSTVRAGFSRAWLDDVRPDLVVLSPGPGRPADFDLARTLSDLAARAIPTFGVCLGLQGMVEYFGGKLGTLRVPVHGKPSRVRVLSGGRLFAGLPNDFTVGRYHSLFAVRKDLPCALEVTAESEDGVVMAIEHRERPMAAVQFHPESILTLDRGIGRRIVDNAISMAT